MKKLIRGLYKIFIKNRFIRIAWMLGLSVWGVKWATDTYLVNKKAFFSKTILALSPDDITTFTIRKGEDDMIFARADSNWLVVHNNITLPLSNDSVAVFLQVFRQLNSHSVKKLPDVPLAVSDENTAAEKPNIVVFITRKNNVTDSLSIFYAEKDSLTGQTLTYCKLPEERLLHGVTPDLNRIFSVDFNSFRHDHILSFDRADVSKITVRSLSDTVSFYAKDSVNWTFNQDKYAVLADSFNLFVKKMGILRGGKFYDGVRDFTDKKNIIQQFILYFQEDSAVLTAYRRERLFILHSSQNKDNYFPVDSLHPILKRPEAFIRLKK